MLVIRKPSIIGELQIRCILHILRRQANVILQLQFGILITLQRREINNQIVLDGKHGVRAQIGVVAREDLRGHAREVRMADHEMDVGGPHGVAVQQLQQQPGGTVRGQRVRGRPQDVEVVVAVLVGAELAAQVVGLLVLGVLEVVLAVGRGLPDVDHDVRDRFLGDKVGDSAAHEGGLAVVRAADDVVAVFAEGGVGRPERAQDGRGGRRIVRAGFDELVRDFIDEAARNRKLVS